MIGVGPHQMTVADWVSLGVLQFGLFLAAAIAVGLAVCATRSPR